MSLSLTKCLCYTLSFFFFSSFSQRKILLIFLISICFSSIWFYIMSRLINFFDWDRSASSCGNSHYPFCQSSGKIINIFSEFEFTIKTMTFLCIFTKCKIVQSLFTETRGEYHVGLFKDLFFIILCYWFLSIDPSQECTKEPHGDSREQREKERREERQRIEHQWVVRQMAIGQLEQMASRKAAFSSDHIEARYLDWQDNCRLNTCLKCQILTWNFYYKRNDCWTILVLLSRIIQINLAIISDASNVLSIVT